jgi:hypothetical protein
MKKFLQTALPFFAAILLLNACSKEAIEEAKKSEIYNAMTTGEWYVAKLMIGNNDSTARFSNYKFRFNTNGTVISLLNGTQNSSGTWVINEQLARITTNYEAAAPAPLPRLNGTWSFLQGTTLTMVIATKVEGDTYQLELRK